MGSVRQLPCFPYWSLVFIITVKVYLFWGSVRVYHNIYTCELGERTREVVVNISTFWILASQSLVTLKYRWKKKKTLYLIEGMKFKSHYIISFSFNQPIMFIVIDKLLL